MILSIVTMDKFTRPNAREIGLPVVGESANDVDAEIMTKSVILRGEL